MSKTSLEIVELINNSAADLLTKIGELEVISENLESKISEQNDEIEELEGELNDIEEDEDSFNFELRKDQNNLRNISCLEELFENLDRIPINELEELVNKYKL